MTLKIIDLFAGIGGIRRGFEQACRKVNINCQCVFTSEIKPHAVNVLQQNYPNEIVSGDITKIASRDIPDFDVLLGGFPCQPFSSAGKRLGFEDTRGTLFFEIARILKEKQPKGFILENVEGLVNHDRQDKKAQFGKTFETILNTLKDLGYYTSWKIFNAKDFGLPQERKRIYIVGSRTDYPNLDTHVPKNIPLRKILEQGLPCYHSRFVDLVLKKYSIPELYGKSFKDKRGGQDNIHSWDLEVKGKVSSDEKKLLELLLKERRKKKWAAEIGIQWMDGMPLTEDQIATFYNPANLAEILKDLTDKGYLKLEHPKQLIQNKRVQDPSLPKGYNIVTGKMSFEVNSILDPAGYAPTLVAMDLNHLFVPDGSGIRRLTKKEGLRLFGYPETLKFDVPYEQACDLLGNTVAVPVIEYVASCLLEKIV